MSIPINSLKRYIHPLKVSYLQKAKPNQWYHKELDKLRIICTNFQDYLGRGYICLFMKPPHNANWLVSTCMLVRSDTSFGYETTQVLMQVKFHLTTSPFRKRISQLPNRRYEALKPRKTYCRTCWSQKYKWSYANSYELWYYHREFQAAPPLYLYLWCCNLLPW